MKVIFLDIDGVLNSHQSVYYWHHKNERRSGRSRTSKQYLAMKFCPIARSNLEELIRQVPDLKVVVSSTWRRGETAETLKKQLWTLSKLIRNAIIDVTPSLASRIRGEEIQDWLDRHPNVSNYAIIDDDRDMLESQFHNFVHINAHNGYQWTDMLSTLRILGEKYI